MLFADDSYLYCKASVREATEMVRLLRSFELASGQQVNFQKSSVFFNTNTAQESRQEICSLMGIREADSQSMYLGLPSMLGRNKSELLGFIKDRVRNRIQGWKGKVLSRAGKEILIKTVVQALPNYFMNVFVLPVEMCKEMEQMMSTLLWKSSNKKGKGINWMKWDRMTACKESGCMGFKKLRDHNLALLGKQAWRLVVNDKGLVGRIFRLSGEILS